MGLLEREHGLCKVCRYPQLCWSSKISDTLAPLLRRHHARPRAGMNADAKETTDVRLNSALNLVVPSMLALPCRPKDSVDEGRAGSRYMQR